MDLSKGISLNQQNYFEIQQLWMPTTPAKPSTASSQRSQLPGTSYLDSRVNDSTGAQKTALPWEFTCQLGSSSSSILPNYLQDVIGSQAAALDSSGHATNGSIVMLYAPATSSTKVDSMERWSPLLSGNVNAACNVSGTSEMPPCAPLLVQIGSQQEMPAIQNMLLPFNGNVILSASHSNSTCSSSGHNDQYRIPVTCLPNLNSLPECLMSASRTMETSAPQTPATTEKYYRRVQDKQPSPEVSNLFQGGARGENLMQKKVTSSPLALEKLASIQDINVVSDEMSNQLIGVEKSCTQQEHNVIDLNVTPQKRTQRKKHRPRVIIEGKSSRTPKPVTPLPGTHKQGMQKENTSCKRKYVRRMKDVTSTESTLNALGEVVDPESRARAKSARRFLNFDLEESNTSDEFSAAMSMFRKVLGDHVQEACDKGAIKSSGVKEIVDCNQEQDHNTVNLLLGTVSDLNNSTYQSHNECRKMIEIPAPTTEVNKNMGASEKHMSTLKPSVNRCKKLARKTDYMEAGVNPESSSEAAQSNLTCNRISDAPLKDTRRENILADEALVSAQQKSTHSYNLRGCFSKDYDVRRQTPCIKEIHKRIRMEKGKHNEATTSNFSSKLIYTSNIWKMTQLSNNPHEFTFDAQSSIAEDKMQASKTMLSFNQTKEDAHNNLTVSSKLAFLSGIRGFNTNSSPTKSSRKKNKDIIQPSTPQKLSGYSNCLENKICEKQAHQETSEDVNKHVKAKTRRGTKKQDQVHPLNPTPSNTKQTYLKGHEAASDGNSPMYTIANGGSTLTTRSLNGKNLNPEIISLVCQSKSCFTVSAYSSISFGELVPFIDPVDDITQKLSQLHIGRCHEVASSQAKKAVVPYVGHKGMMIPYERNLLTKRRRPRAKVDLDPESNRVWKLLMGKDDNEGEHRADVEKWWEEERKVFRGRVDSFIARMHLVQGDRRFSQWKGSVVDSVVGVFLTQNVSDHLSSSAFMSLAANFPLQSRGKCSSYGEKGNRSMENQNRCIIPVFDPPKLQRNLLDPGFCFHNSSEINVIENEAQMESSSCVETIGCGTGNIITNYCKGKDEANTIDLHEKKVILYHDAPVSGSGTAVTDTGSTSLADMEDVSFLEDVISSQMSAVSSKTSMCCHSQSSKHNGSNSFSKFEAENLLSGSMNNALGCSSFTQLIRMAESSCFEEFYGHSSGTISETKPLEVHFAIENNPSVLEQLDNSKGTCQSCRFDSNLHHALFGLSDMSPPSEPCQSDDPLNSKIMENNVNLLKENIRAQLHSTSFEEISGNKFEVTSSELEESTSLLKLLSPYKTTNTIDSYAPIWEQPTQQITFSDMEFGANMQSDSHHKIAENIIDASTKNENPHVCSTSQTEDMRSTAESIHDANQPRDQIVTSKNQESTASNNYMEYKLDPTCKVEKNLTYESYKFLMISPETPMPGTKPKKNRPEVEKNTYDWESLRKDVCCNEPAEGRSNVTMDSLDWEAVRSADVSKIAETIRERGMNNKLAERIKELLNRLVREHGTIDLEWLRDVPPEKAKDFLLSIRGLGLKSAECVRLLTLQQLAFPVDTNVGRICVRLGWVPLQPLPESLQLHLLELYPVLETIQKYLWPRLCKLDQRTLYELHYQMITFGKVFCTKSKPNCNSCPMRGECKHFASAFASARLALPAPEDKSIVSFTAPIASEKSHTVLLNPRSVPQLEGSSQSDEFTFQNNCEPIVEEPASPEPECPETMENAIEDAFYEDPDEIPTIKLNFEEFTQNLQNYMQQNMELQNGSFSKALVALTPEAASIPMPKLKNVTRLRTEHQVYEIPDSHPMLEGLDPREPDDPSPYLLALWTPGETALSTETPKACCNSQDTGQLCDNNTCFACNSIREAESLKVRGTLLIPCRTAMRGSFPLNGTYFQVNEVFADHHSSCNPINVPRNWLWNLSRRTVYFGTSIPTIFRGLTTEEIQHCFWRGFVCVRGFDRVTRAPKPLYARLHFPASKAPKNRKATATTETSATPVTTTREGEQSSNKDLIMIRQSSNKC